MHISIELIWGTIAAFGVISTVSVTAITRATASGKESGSITMQLKNICQTVEKIANDITNIEIEFKKNIAIVAKLEIKVATLEKEFESLKSLYIGGTK